MIVVTMEIWPKGDKEKARGLGAIIIANDGTGDENSGNYLYNLCHAGKYFGKRKEPYKTGKVKGFLRKLSPYRLLCRCLKDAGEI